PTRRSSDLRPLPIRLPGAVWHGKSPGGRGVKNFWGGRGKAHRQIDLSVYGSGGFRHGRERSGSETRTSSPAAKQEGGGSDLDAAARRRAPARPDPSKPGRPQVAPAHQGVVAAGVAVADGQRVPGDRPRWLGSTGGLDRRLPQGDERQGAQGAAAGNPFAGSQVRPVARGPKSAAVGDRQGRRGRAPAAAQASGGAAAAAGG